MKKSRNRIQAVNEHEHELVKQHFFLIPQSIKHPDERDKNAFQIQPGIFSATPTFSSNGAISSRVRKRKENWYYL